MKVTLNGIVGVKFGEEGLNLIGGIIVVGGDGGEIAFK